MPKKKSVAIKSVRSEILTSCQRIPGDCRELIRVQISKVRIFQ
ncbi:hypothetical protein X975_23530, partial [Stegodyphus mimosarum]